MSKWSSLRLTEGTFLAIFFPSISPRSLLLEQLYPGKQLWFGMSSMQAETPILDNCSEMCLCRGAWGKRKKNKKLTANIITVLAEQWKKLETESEGGGDTQGGRQCGKNRSLHGFNVYIKEFTLKYTLYKVALCSFWALVVVAKKLFSEFSIAFRILLKLASVICSFSSEVGSVNWCVTAVPPLRCTYFPRVHICTHARKHTPHHGREYVGPLLSWTQCHFPSFFF